MTEPSFKAALFDLDGTLIDSMPYWHDLAERFLDKRGITPDSETADALERLSLSQAAVYMKNKYCLYEDVEQILGELGDMIDEIYSGLCSLKPGAAEYLELLKRRRIPMALVTITAKKSAKKALKRLGIKKYFSAVVTDTDVGKSKNHPDIYLEAARKLRAKPQETAVFEDSVRGGLTAKKAGFIVYAVRDGSNRDEFGAYLEAVDGEAQWI